MDTTAIIAVVAVVVVLVVAVLVIRPMLRRRRLQQRFGPEYDRVVDSHDNRAVAERELVEREKRYKQLELRPLSPEARERYAVQWMQVQAQFVDTPQDAVTNADRLVTALMGERGYPTEGYEQQLADLSVEHAATLEHYRAAHETRGRIGDGEVSTEDLRAAMVHYRALFMELLGPEPAGTAPTTRSDDRDADIPPTDADADHRPDATADHPDRRETDARTDTADATDTRARTAETRNAEDTGGRTGTAEVRHEDATDVRARTAEVRDADATNGRAKTAEVRDGEITDGRTTDARAETADGAEPAADTERGRADRRQTAR